MDSLSVAALSADQTRPPGLRYKSRRVDLLDISVPIREGMVVYEGDPEVRLGRFASIEAGATANLSRLDFGVHSGTHVDAPIHFLDGAAGVEQLPLDALVGPAHVVAASHVQGELDEATLRRLDLPDAGDRLLFKTPNSLLWERDGFAHDFISLTGDGAAYLVARGVRLVGIDYLSIGDADAHRALLGAGVVVVESLDLRRVEPGPYRLICLPLKIVGADGAPARALLIRNDSGS
jgi:arylformamidase